MFRSLKKISPIFYRSFCEIQQRKYTKNFPYGSDSLVKLEVPNALSDIELTTLWEDNSEIEISLFDDEFLSPNDFDLEESGRTIKVFSDKHHSGTRQIGLRVPEYSSLDLKFEGNLEQKDTEIDAKLKGDVKIDMLNSCLQTVVQFRRVKTEFADVKLNNTDLIVHRYWETKDGTFHKLNPGIIDVKRMGASNKLDFVLKDVNLKISSLYTNMEPITHEGEIANFTLENGKTLISTFRGTISVNAINNTFQVSEGTFGKINGSFQDCNNVDIYFNDIRESSKLNFKNCENVILRVNPKIKLEFRRYFEHEEDNSRVQIIFEESKGNLFGDLVNKFKEIKKQREAE